MIIIVIFSFGRSSMPFIPGWDAGPLIANSFVIVILLCGVFVGLSGVVNRNASLSWAIILGFLVLFWGKTSVYYFGPLTVNQKAFVIVVIALAMLDSSILVKQRKAGKFNDPDTTSELDRT